MSKAQGALGICVVVLAAFASVVGARPAYASASPKPPTDWSYYVYPGDSGTGAQQLGCSQAKWDNSQNHNSFVILDYGAQRRDGKGTYLPSTTIYWTNAADENYALHFAYGYQSCSPSHVLILAIGTSNDGAVTDGALGAAWGSVVQSAAQTASKSGYSNVAVQGAIDAEPGFGPFPHFQGWEMGDKSGGGYTAKSATLIDDFGSADGCPQTLGQDTNVRCGWGWTVADEYAAVWGWGPNEGTPEIYYDGCGGYANQVNQWANVSAYGARFQRKGMVRFVGPLDQGSCLGSTQSWNEFQAALTKIGATDVMKFSAQMVTK